MQNDKLGIFDLLTFIIPGGTCLYFLGFAIKPFAPLDVLVFQGDSNYLLIPFFFLSYFLGHLLSFWGRKLEYKGMGEKDVWMFYLSANMDRTKRLDVLCQQKFNYSFIDGNEINIKRAGDFFDNAYVLLETKQKSDKIALLMAQFGFFRTATVVFMTVAFFIGSMILVAKSYNIAVYFQHFCLLIFCIISIFIAKRLMHERKRWMMTAVYQNFEAFCLQ